MGMIIDTNVFIDAENGKLPLNRLHHFAHYGEAYISVITMSELLAGVHAVKSLDEKLKRSAFVESVLSGISTLMINNEVARTYAELWAYTLKSRSSLKRNSHDLQIAATAITYGYPILTSNKKDFQKIPGVVIETPF